MWIGASSHVPLICSALTPAAEADDDDEDGDFSTPNVSLPAADDGVDGGGGGERRGLR